MLKDPDFIQFIHIHIFIFHIHIHIFLEANANSASHSTIWEALKAFMRGHILSYGAYKHLEEFRIRNKIIGIRTFFDQ